MLPLRTLLFGLLFTCFSSDAFARKLPNWPYEKLLSDSDLVIIGEPICSTNTSDVFDHEGSKQENFTGINTDFRIVGILKGAANGKQVTVLHFRYSDKVEGISNGALFVRFQLKAREFKGQIIHKESKEGIKRAPEMVNLSWPRPDYLLFLKLRKDGRYECVSGQYDAALSCREVTRAEDYFPSDDD